MSIMDTVGGVMSWRVNNWLYIKGQVNRCML